MSIVCSCYEFSLEFLLLLVSNTEPLAGLSAYNSSPILKEYFAHI